MASGLSHLFYPRICEGCSKPLLPEEEVLCLNCNVYNLPRTAYHHIADNETAMRFAGRIPVQKATSLAYFTPDGLLQHLLHRLKYEGKEYIGTFLGRQLGYDLRQLDWAAGIDFIVPIPLHEKKLAERGYNQSEIIAEGMSGVLNIPVDTGVLARVRYTESQTQKSRTERLENMKDAFKTIGEGHYGKHILLVDDVLTTGATLEAAAAALLSSGGVNVSIATVGIAT